MHRSFIISEEEKKKILIQHQNATSSLYLNLNEDTETISLDNIQNFLNGVKEEILQTFDSLDSNNLQTEKLNLKKKIESILNQIKSVNGAKIDQQKLNNILKDVERLKQLLDKLDLKNIKQIKRHFHHYMR
jgi:phosphomevalonate kinase